MTKRPHILITNDDGIDAEGIKRLYDALKPHADITVVAPSHQRSGAGLGITLHTPLFIQKHIWDDTTAWSVTGTPADSVRLAFGVILKNKPDLILSGINSGANHGRVLFYSGTVGAVLEGALRGVPGIAVSCYDMVNPNYTLVQKHIWTLVEHFLKHPIPDGSFINVNFPEKTIPFQGVRLARQGKGYWIEDPNARAHPDTGDNYYWPGNKWSVYEEHEESDVELLSKGYATVVPVKIAELTDHALLDYHKGPFQDLTF